MRQNILCGIKWSRKYNEGMNEKERKYIKRGRESRLRERMRWEELLEVEELEDLVSSHVFLTFSTEKYSLIFIQFLNERNDFKTVLSQNKGRVSQLGQGVLREWEFFFCRSLLNFPREILPRAPGSEGVCCSNWETHTLDFPSPLYLSLSFCWKKIPYWIRDPVEVKKSGGGKNWGEYGDGKMDDGRLKKETGKKKSWNDGDDESEARMIRTVLKREGSGSLSSSFPPFFPIHSFLSFVP